MNLIVQDLYIGAINRRVRLVNIKIHLLLLLNFPVQNMK